MFDFVRKHTKIMMFLMFLLIIPAFVLVGINGFRSMGGSGETVAKVGTYSIKREEWDAAHQNDVERMRASNPRVDVKLLDSPEARYVSLERLVRQRVLAQAATDQHLTSTDASLARELQQDPNIAALRGPDGKLDIERYRQLVSMQGLTPEGFEARVRKDLTLRQVERAVLASEMAPTRLANVTLNAFFGRRELQTATFAPADYRDQVHPDDAALQAYYQAHQDLFQAPESANVEYVQLDLESVKKGIALNESDVKSYYEQNVARLSGKEERRASHILITAPKGQPAADHQKARDKAMALLEQVRKAPDTFADVAKKNSQDPGSAANGGDLDSFARGAMVKPFEDAAFALKKGEVSDVVESDFGFHIIKLTDIRSPKQKSFEELRASIETDLRNQQAQHKFAEVAELFTNTVYEQSDSLKPAADKLKLEMHTANAIQRKPLPGVTGVLANPQLLTALFSPDAIEKKRNTEALEVGPNLLVAARVVQYTPARVMPLTEVGSTVRERLVAVNAAELAKKDGMAKLDAWKKQPDSAKLAAALTVSRDQQTPLAAPAVLNAALRADVSTLPAWVGVDLGGQGYVVVRINKVLERTAPAADVAVQERAQLAQWLATAQDRAYVETLKTRYNVQIKVPKPVAAANTLPVVQE